jgi:predicted helicase
MEEFADYRGGKAKSELLQLADEFVDNDPKRISWSRSLKTDLSKGTRHEFDAEAVRESAYRPFCKLQLYHSKVFNELHGQMGKIFPNHNTLNRLISVAGVGATKDFSCLITNVIAERQMLANAQCFPLYLYESADDSGKLDLGKNDGDVIDGYRRRDAITDAILKTFRCAYGAKVTKEDIFYYVYGVLHSPEYRTRFAADLKKMLPRIPLTKETKDFTAFSEAGRKLAEWHLNYETVPTWPVEEIHDKLDLGLEDTYKVGKMTFARPTAEQKAAGAKWDKTRIIYNNHVTITKIPLEAYEYVVNGKPAIEWIIERYQVTRDKDSGIVNDPNDWCREHKQPRYIVDLIERVVRVSVETMKIVAKLPALNEVM